MLAIHSALAMYYLAMAKLHQDVNDPLKNAYLYFFYFLGPQYPPFFPVVAVGALVLAACHLLAALNLLVPSSYWKCGSSVLSTSSRRVPNLVTSPTRLGRVRSTLRRCFLGVFGRCGVLGIDYRHARLVFVCRELFEVSCQAVQANRLSNLVSVVWVNRLFVIALLGKCWQSPFLRQICRRLYPTQFEKRVALEKILEIASDGLLGIIYAAIIPYSIFRSYSQQFDNETQTFGVVNYFSDDWVIRAMSGLKQVFVGSWFDLLCLLGPDVSTLSECTVVMSCLRPASKKTVRPSKQLLAAGPKSSIDGQFSPRASRTVRRVSVGEVGPRRVRFLVSMLNTIIAWFGLTVLVCHLYATTIALFGVDSGCLLEMRPWGKSSYTCVTLEVSCTQKMIHGEQDKINHVLSAIDSTGLQSLVFSHCPRLEMPSHIRAFTNLKRIKIFNSSIAA